MMIAVIFVAESVPSFGPVLDLMGASTVTLTCVIFPPIFYLFLSTREKKALQSRQPIESEDVSIRDVVQMTDKKILALCCFIVVVGIIGGCEFMRQADVSYSGYSLGAATYSSTYKITVTNFEVPCYVKVFQASKEDSNPKSTICCGLYRNVSAHNDPSICKLD